jgi:hypothetical protein
VAPWFVPFIAKVAGKLGVFGWLKKTRRSFHQKMVDMFSLF